MALKANKHQQVKPFSVGDVRGGINLSSPPNLINDNEVQVLKNFEFGIDGELLRTRGGLSSPLFTFSDKIKSVFYDYEMNSHLVVLENNYLYMYVIGNEPIMSGILLGNNKPVFCKFGGNVYIASGDRLQKFDYSRLTTISSPLCDDVFERFGRLAITKAGTDNVMYSAVGDPTGWTDDPNDDSSSKEVEIGYKDGGDICGVLPLSTDIIVFKTNGKIFQLSNEYPDWGVYNIGKDSDFLYRFGAEHLSNEIIYMSRQGLRSLSTSAEYGNFQSKEFGEKINSELRKSVYNPVIWKLNRKKQIIINPDKGNKLIVYHYLIGAFTTMEFPSTVADIAESPVDVVIAMDNSLYYWSQAYKTDNGIQITSTIKSKMLKSNQEMLIKKIVGSILSTDIGSGTIKINNIHIPVTFDSTLNRFEFRMQILDKSFEIEFSTTSQCTFDFIFAEVAI